MTSVPRDPAFWKRFSVAVHSSEGKHPSPFAAPVQEAVVAPESWLDQERRKKRQSRLIITFSVIGFITVLVVVILALIYLDHHGFYMHGEKFSFP